MIKTERLWLIQKRLNPLHGFQSCFIPLQIKRENGVAILADNMDNHCNTTQRVHCLLGWIMSDLILNPFMKGLMIILNQIWEHYLWRFECHCKVDWVVDKDPKYQFTRYWWGLAEMWKVQQSLNGIFGDKLRSKALAANDIAVNFVTGYGCAADWKRKKAKWWRARIEMYFWLKRGMCNWSSFPNKPGFLLS